MQETLVIIKPDAVERKLIGEIISRFEKKGLTIINMTLTHLDKEILQEHYAEHRNKAFFDELISFMSSGPVILLVLKGDECIKSVRNIIGATNPFEAAPGTIRGDFGHSLTKNLVHASDSPKSAQREIELFKKYF